MTGAARHLIVLTSTFPRWPGDTVPPFVYELSRRMTAACRVTVIAPHASGCPARETMDGMEVIRFRYAPAGWESLAYGGGILANLKASPWRWALVPFFLAAELLAVVRVVPKRPGAVVHAHWVIPQGLVAVLAMLMTGRGGGRVLCTLHGGDVHALGAGLMSRIRHWVLAKSGRITVVSEAMRQSLGAAGADARTRVMPMGIDTAGRFVPPPANDRRSRHRILFAGRVVEKKGLEYLIKAMPMVLEKFPDATLVVAGDGPLLAHERMRAERLSLGRCIEFLGAVPNHALPAQYASAEVFVAPFVVDSRGDQEGFGLVVAEAQACECPVVVSDLPAVRDLVEDGVTGLLAAPGDPAGIAASICRCFSDPDLGRAMAQRARSRVVERYDWGNVAGKYLDLIDGMMTT